MQVSLSAEENILKNSFPTNTALLIIDVQQGFDDPKMGKKE
jgi:hypothetical protein